MNREIEWGPEIRVDGVRPEFIRNTDMADWRAFGSFWMGAASCRDFYWPKMDAIRLPANHPHYATETGSTAPNGGEVGQEVVERMTALVRRLSGGFFMHAVNDSGIGATEAVIEAQQIVALLPEPVDGDLVLARELASKAVFYGQCQSNNGGRSWQDFRDGGCDAGDVIGDILAALKSRALEKEAGR